MTYSVTPLVQLLRDEIGRDGPIPFSRFMEVALYHPEHGYYRRDPFGRAGDFFTAEQLQPVFGRLIAQYAAALCPPEVCTIVELGAGRREMAPFFQDFAYVPVDIGFGSLPDAFSGLVFANEFFDALPVDVVIMRCGELRHVRVDFRKDGFVWIEAEPASADAAAFAGEIAEGTRLEVNLSALEWLDRVGGALQRGSVLIIDYGYTRREIVRFPEGTLMSYRRHQALDDVLADPGERDITSHVPFSVLEAHAPRAGLTPVRFESMAAMLLRAGEPDQFAAALAASDEREATRLRMQLKTLLFGMGETFRVLLLTKNAAQNKNGPETGAAEGT
jgi:SAM-dependent MidA family methyltransferase